MNLIEHVEGCLSAEVQEDCQTCGDSTGGTQTGCYEFCERVFFTDGWMSTVCTFQLWCETCHETGECPCGPVEES